MKRLPLVLMCLVIVGCTTPRQPELLNTSFDDLKPVTLNPSLPAKPKAVEVYFDGQVYGGFDLRGMNDLNHYSKQSEANTEALRELVTAHNHVIEQRNLLTRIAKQQEDRGNTYSRLYTESQNQLESERTRSSIEKAILQLIILVGIAL